MNFKGKRRRVLCKGRAALPLVCRKLFCKGRVDKLSKRGYNYRIMKHNQSSEDYLETILLLSGELEDVHQIEIARKMGVSQPAVQKALKNLKAQEYIRMDGLHISLTPAGREYAAKVYHMHCTIRRFLIAHGVSYAAADADACEMEHYISEETFAAMERFLDKSTEQ